MENLERKLFDLVEGLDTDECSGIGIHQHDWMYPDFDLRVYVKDGYCFNIRKEHQCEPSETNDHDIYQLQDDGCTYEFSSDNEGFKNLNLNEAILIIEKAHKNG